MPFYKTYQQTTFLVRDADRRVRATCTDAEDADMIAELFNSQESAAPSVGVVHVATPHATWSARCGAQVENRSGGPNTTYMFEYVTCEQCLAPERRPSDAPLKPGDGAYWNGEKWIRPNEARNDREERIRDAAEKALVVWGSAQARRYVCEIIDIVEARSTDATR